MKLLRSYEMSMGLMRWQSALSGQHWRVVLLRLLLLLDWSVLRWNLKLRIWVQSWNSLLRVAFWIVEFVLTSAMMWVLFALILLEGVVNGSSCIFGLECCLFFFLFNSLLRSPGRLAWEFNSFRIQHISGNRRWSLGLSLCFFVIFEAVLQIVQIPQ